MKKNFPAGYINYFTRLQTALVILLLLVFQGIPHAQETSTEHAWPLPAPELPSGALTETETYLIGQALASVNMTWDDMGYRKDYVDDPFRLTAVQRALDEPGYLVEWNYAWDDFLYENPTAGEIISRAYNDLDCDPDLAQDDLLSLMFRPQFPPVNPLLVEKLPRDLAVWIHEMDIGLKLSSDQMMSEVIGSLTPEDID
ncbi:MAG: hypothetical protein NTY09_05935 [bacterium]|nr:hypothetical protein [bacterium]